MNIQNQTLETTPISNANKNIVPLGTAQGNNPSLQINPTNNNTAIKIDQNWSRFDLFASRFSFLA